MAVPGQIRRYALRREGMDSMSGRWARYLGAPVDAASLGVFRIVFGTMLAWDAVRYLVGGWVESYYVLPSIHFTYYGFDFVTPWPGSGMYVHYWGLAVLGLLVALGLFYRTASVLLFFGYSYVFLLDEAVYMNHHYLMALLTFLLMWMPAERAFSVDAWRNPGRAGSVPPSSVPRWCVLLLRFQLFIVYFYGAIAKLNPDWLRGEPMYSIIERRLPEVPEIAYHLPPAFLAYAIAYSGILVDAIVPVLLIFPRTLPYGFAAATIFHLLNEIFLNIGVFSYLMTGAITIFFAPDWPRRLWARFQEWRKRDTTAVPSAEAELGERATPKARPSTPRGSIALLLGLHLYVLAQILFPFRHLLYPGYVSWTEEGHRFAWQMKLRKKESTMTITAVDPATGRSWTLDPAADLTPRQLRKLHTFPDILVQYAHYHRDRLRAEGVAAPIITADWMCSLNGAPAMRLVDPNVNLATTERSIFPAAWILPYDKQRAPPKTEGEAKAHATGFDPGSATPPASSP